MVKNNKLKKKAIVGVVISDKMDKSVTIGWETRKRHPIYKKFVKQNNKLKAHDEKNAAKMGDLVRVIETRPISKDKNWKVVEIIEKHKQL
ncbi:MAG: 30S ribosomal protein S17 [Candidatus Omnitrophota bacterium]